jgi:uncharacterized membrane protein
MGRLRTSHHQHDLAQITNSLTQAAKAAKAKALAKKVASKLAQPNPPTIRFTNIRPSVSLRQTRSRTPNTRQVVVARFVNMQTRVR